MANCVSVMTKNAIISPSLAMEGQPEKRRDENGGRKNQLVNFPGAAAREPKPT